MKTVSIVLLLAALGGCAPQIEGAYLGENGAPAFTLAHGKYYGTSVAANEARAARGRETAPVPIPYPYKVDGRQLIVEKRDGATAFEIVANGKLKARQGDHDTVFVRK